MRPELPILSFLCTILLAGLAPLHVQSRNIALVALLSWLLLCNIIQGANSIIWSGNANARFPVWCDISTKILFGARIAILFACTCMSMHLYSLSANQDGRLRRYRTVYESALCTILPLIYMTFQFIVQDHRFDLAEDFGCVSAVYTSVPAIILVWIPPLILCIATFSFATLAVWHYTHQHPLLSNLAGLSSRAVTITFLRPLFTASMTSILLFSTTILDVHARIASADGLLPWRSWNYVHANLSQVRIVQSTETSTLLAIEATWWTVPVSSLIFAGMALVGLISCVQHDAYTGRSLGKWFRTTMLRRPEGDTFIQSSIDLSSHISMTSPTPPVPVHLKSGWDESLGTGRAAKIQFKRPALRCDIPASSSLSMDTDGDSDASFKASTLNYLGSPTGQKASTLSLLPSLESTLTLVPKHIPSVPALSSLNIPDGATGVSASSAHSILSSPWPEPPSTIPVTPTKSTSQQALSPRSPAHHPRSLSEVSLNTSLASSTVSTSPYLIDPDIFLHSVSTSPHRAPFQDGIPTSMSGIPLTRSPKRMPSNEILSARALTSSIRRAAGKRREQDPIGEAVYMTVVHETQAC